MLDRITGGCTICLLGMMFDNLGMINEKTQPNAGFSEVPRPGGPGGRQQRNAGRGDVDECLRGESSRGPLRHVALSWWMMDADGCRWMLMDADGGWVVTWWSELFKLEGCQLEWGWMVSNVNRIWGTCPGAWPHPNIKATMVAKKIKRYISKTHKKKHGSNGSFHDLFLFSYFLGEALLRWTCATRTIPAARCGDDGGFFSAYVQMPAIINGQFSCSCLCFLCLCIGVCMILYWLNAQASQALDSFVFGVISFSHTGDGARL